MAKTKRKGKVMGKKVAGFFSAIAVLAIGVAAAHFLDIFTFKDWKELIGYRENVQTEGTAEVHFIDVGQGDCSLIISDGVSMLIDTGEKENAEKICEYLDENGVGKLDYLMLTHPHSDHMGGAAEIINTVEVEKIYIPKLPEASVPTTKFYENFLLAVQENNLKLTAPVPGETLEIGDCSMEILSPLDDYDDEYNNYSITAILTHGSDKFLFTGDIEKEAENDIIDSGRLEKVDVLKVAHHGSNTSSKKEFLSIAEPKYAVIMCGDNNSYNHPNDDTVEKLRKYTDLIYRTDLDGTIVFTSSESGLSVKTEKEE